MSNISYLAIITIILSEIKDYLKEYQFTLIAPLITTLLFVFIFSTLDRYYSFNEFNNSYIHFLVPGIIMTLVIQTSFNHLSEIIINMKQIGSFNDYLISPISRVELFISFIFSSVFVCSIIGYLNLFVLSFFADFQTVNFLNLSYYMIICILIFSSLGALTGFLSFTWDVQSSISNFFVVPISFMSGTFFPITSIDEKYQFIFYYNPIFHLVNGFRSSFYINDISKYNNLFIMTTLIFFLVISLYIFKRGFRVIN